MKKQPQIALGTWSWGSCAEGGDLVFEQGELTGMFDAANPLPAGSGRGEIYNQLLPKIEQVINAVKATGSPRNAIVSQMAMAWAIGKETLPLIGVTKAKHVEEAAQAATIALKVNHLEKVAQKARVDTKGLWKNPII